MSQSAVARALAFGPMPFAEPGVPRHYAPDRTVRIEHIDLRLSVDPVERTFSGTARLRVRPLASYEGRFAFDLDEVKLGTVTDGEGAPLEHRFGDGKLEILAPSAPSEVVVTWSGAEPQRGLYFTGPTEADPERQHMAWTQCQDEDGHFVFPCHDHPGVKHSWSLTLDAPVGYTVLCSGGRVSVEEADGRVVGRFEVAQPMPAYLVSFVAARLSEVRARDVGDVSIRYFVPEGQEEPIERTFGRTPDMIEHFSSVTGVPYPWPRYDQVVVHDFIFGAWRTSGARPWLRSCWSTTRRASTGRPTPWSPTSWPTNGSVIWSPARTGRRGGSTSPGRPTWRRCGGSTPSPLKRRRGTATRRPAAT